MNVRWLLIASLSMSSAFARPPADLQDKFLAFANGHAGGAALAWVDQDGTTFLSAGQFSGEDPRPITPDTQFEIGSLSKVFTALLLANSERAGKASRLDSAAKYLLPKDDPEQTALAKITLLALATHTSGLGRMPANVEPYADYSSNPEAKYDRASLVSALRGEGPRAPSGRAMVYSNFGFALLGEALASAWGESYEDALKTRVLTPLGLKETRIGSIDAPASANLAPAHVGTRSLPNLRWQALAPAGGVQSSVRDLAVLMSVYLHKTKSPLSADADATLQTQSDADNGGKVALGWMLIEDANQSVAWHNGATVGSHSFMAFDRKTGRGLVILANSPAPSERLGFELLQVTPPSAQTAQIEHGEEFVGHYPFTPAFAIDISERDGGLWAQATRQPPFGLRPSGKDRFAVVGVVAEIIFHRDSAGKVISLTLDQNGRQPTALREKPKAAK